MATRLGWMLVAAVLITAPAAAQPWTDDRLREDSLGIPADTVALPAQGMWGMECDPTGLRVVRDSADFRAIERFPGCDASAFPALGGELYVHVSIGGDCHARFGARAYRSESRREYRVVMIKRYGGCRAGKLESWWIRLPPLPQGWTVGFTTLRTDREERGWPPR